MINPFADVKWRPSGTECRFFAMSMAVGLPVMAAALALIVRWRSGLWVEWSWWVAGVGLIIGVAGWVFPRAIWPVYILWYAIGGAIGFVISNLFLVLTFYLVVTPIGWLLRCLRKDPLECCIDPDAKSYWKNSEKTVDPEQYFRQF